MKRLIRWIGCIAVLLACFGPWTVTQTDDEASLTVEAALKQIDSALKGLNGLRARVEYAEVIATGSINGSGTLHVDFEGHVRADIDDTEQVTFLLRGSFLHLYWPDRATVEVFDLKGNPHRLAQYALLGFAPHGSGLKKRYTVALIEQGELDGTPTLLFDLDPKDKDVRRAIKQIRLWVDRETGLPVQQMISHSTAGIQLVVRYLDAAPDDDLPESLFNPRWPAQTEVVFK